MTRFFNTAGPCRPERHYMLPPERRLPEVRRLVEQQLYFVVHAPRQVGKTTALRTFAEALTAEGGHAAVLVSMEAGAAFADDIGAAEKAILRAWRRSAEETLPPELLPPAWPDSDPGAQIADALNAWARACPRPLVVFLDETDALRDRVLLSVSLAQGPQDALPRIALTRLDAQGELDTSRLLEAFLAFWRQHGEPLLRAAPYAEVAAQLVMMAFLHRVANGGGTLKREYAIGSSRMDLCLRYRKTTLTLELKVWRQGQRTPEPEALGQLDAYLTGLGLSTGWLVIFDQRDGLPPIGERTSTGRATPLPGATSP